MVRLKPRPLKSVNIQIREFIRGSGKRKGKVKYTKSITVYDTTVKEVYNLILKAIKKKARIS